MPEWLYQQSAQSPPSRRHNIIGPDGRLVVQTEYLTRVAGLVPVLAGLSAASHEVVKAYFCHPAVEHVFNDKKDGPFCGYRNIQMLLSYVQAAKTEGHHLLDKHGLPAILNIQDMIEYAWEQGICSHAREETGGIKGTRKWIGTPEVRLSDTNHWSA